MQSPTSVSESTLSQSPFTSVLKDAHLPTAFQHQFLASVDEPCDTVLEGQMDQVWHRPRWLWPLLWLAARFDILFPEVGSQIPATMIVRGERDGAQRPRQQWLRTFAFPTLRHFNAIMAYDDTLGCVVEFMGPGRALRVQWEVRFEPPGTMYITSRACHLMVGGRAIPLASWQHPSVEAVETADLARDDSIHINLRVSHPWLGAIFGYEGTFRLRLLPR